MDSGLVGANGSRESSAELSMNSEVCIVYTRRNRRKAPQNSNSDAPAPIAPEPSVFSLGPASAEPCVSTFPAGNCNLADEGVVLKTIPAPQDGNFVEQQGAVVDFHDTEILAKGSRGGEETLPNGGVELQLSGELEHREERQISGATGGDGCLLSKESRGGEVALPNGGVESHPQSPGELEHRKERQFGRITGGEEHLLDGGTELLSNHGKELDSNNNKYTNGEHQRVASRSELQVDLSASQEEPLNELQCNGGHDDGGDDLNDTSKLKILPNGREEPHISVSQEIVPIGGAELLASGHDRHPNGVSSGVSRNSVLKAVSCLVGDRVRIAMSESSSKVELRGFKRKIENELDQVRIVMKKLEDKSLQISAFDTSITTNKPTYIRSNVGVYNQPQLMRVNSMVGGGGHPQTRPFRQLSVSVMGNNRDVGEFLEREKRTPKANKFYLNSEFLLGKDRLPPESNKKRKPNDAGTKHGIGLGFGVDKNREKVFSCCSNLLQRLMKHKHGWVFNSPVDADKLGLHDYHDIIKHPMDFGTIKTRLTQNWYSSAKQFAEDVRLVFRNAMTYNPKGQDVHTMAEELSAMFEDRWPSVERECFPYQMYYDVGLRNPNPNPNLVPVPTPTRTPTPRKSYPITPTILGPLLIPTPRSAPPMRTFDRSKSISMPVTRPFSMDIPQTVRTPVPKKPKAKDPNKRNMTYEEKQKLSTNLQSLPSEKLDAVVQIINKRSSSLSQHNDEIEVDIDSVDAESLWELDRFITNYKKNLSKNKRKAELAEQAQAAAAHGVVLTNPAPVALDAQREGGNVNPLPVQVAIPGDNASPSNSSSSSSSGSGSSSTDSDSDSSSASEEAGHSPKT